MKKGQGTFEYILLLAGVLLIVVLAIVLLRGGIFQGTQANVQRDTCRSALVQSSACYNVDGSWNTAGSVANTSAVACQQIITYGACDANAAVGANDGEEFCCGAQPN